MSRPAIDVLARNLDDVRRRIAAACARVDRDPSSVRLVAVTKTADLDAIRDLIALGQLDLAENRPQHLAQRAAALPDSVRWHFIGHLQRNKIDLVLPIARMIHSVDSVRLLRSLSAAMARSERPVRLLIEVNVSGEETKSGLAPQELMAAWSEIRSLAGPQLAGFMTMAPQTDDPQVVRPVFRRLYELRKTFLSDAEMRAPMDSDLPELSMGMSGDFEIAVEEGATLVRVGSRLFDEEPERRKGLDG